MTFQCHSESHRDLEINIRMDMNPVPLPFPMSEPAVMTILLVGSAQVSSTDLHAQVTRYLTSQIKKESHK